MSYQHAVVQAGGDQEDRGILQRNAVNFIDFLSKRDEDARQREGTNRWYLHAFYQIILVMFLFHWFWACYVRPEIQAPIVALQNPLFALEDAVVTIGKDVQKLNERSKWWAAP